MPVIQIPFNRSPISVSLSRDPQKRSPGSQSSPATQPPNPAPSPNHELATLALETLNAIATTLRSLDKKRNDQFDNVAAQLVAVATQIAKEALGSDNTLIEDRVKHFADVLLRQVRPNEPVTLFANPDCVSQLESWVASSTEQPVTIQPDAAVPAGDCRIETADKGFLASLDSFLDAAASRTTLARGEG